MYHLTVLLPGLYLTNNSDYAEHEDRGFWWPWKQRASPLRMLSYPGIFLPLTASTNDHWCWLDLFFLSKTSEDIWWNDDFYVCIKFSVAFSLFLFTVFKLLAYIHCTKWYFMEILYRDTILHRLCTCNILTPFTLVFYPLIPFLSPAYHLLFHIDSFYDRKYGTFVYFLKHI